MSVNLPANVRQGIYVITTVLTPTFTYLNQQGTISNFQFGLYSVIVAAVLTLAAVNVNPEA